jgi:predicted N-acetyltransferase YhbS
MATLNVSYPATQADWEKLMAFAKLVRPQDSECHFLHRFRERPDLSATDHALLLEDDQIIATTSMVPHRHYFGDGELEVGELTMMATHPERRLEGHARRLYEHWLDEAQSRNYAYLYMYGPARVYETMGFVASAPAHHFPVMQMSREVLTSVMSPYRVRPLIKSDCSMLEELYDLANCRTPMAEVRSPAYWTYRLSQTHRDGFGWWVVVDENNIPQGYAWADLPHARLREVVAGNEEAARAILQWMRWELMERKLPHFTAQVPLNQRFAQYAIKVGAMVANPHHHYPGNGYATVKLLRLQPLLQALKTDFEKHLCESHYADKDFDFTFLMGDEAVSLRWWRQQLRIAPGSVGHEIRLNETQWAPLLTGYRSINDCENLELTPAERPLMKVLFPGSYPHIWDLEHIE